MKRAEEDCWAFTKTALPNGTSSLPSREDNLGIPERSIAHDDTALQRPKPAVLFGMRE